MAERTSRTSEPMAPGDHLMFRAELDPVRRPTMTAVYVLDRTPDWPDVRDVFERVSREFLRLRRRVVEPTGGMGPARWVTDPDFDLSYHVRREVVPPPGTMRALLDALEPELMSPLDMARPLWRATLWEGLDAGAALVFKSSHAITDGIGGIRMNSLIFDEEPNAARRPMPPVPLPEDVTPDELARATLGRLPRSAVATASQLIGRAGRVTVRVVRDPVGSIGGATRYASSLRRVLGAAPPPSPLLASRSLSRRVLWIELPLDDFRRGAKAGGGSMNDAYLAALTGALRRYHERLGMPVDTLPLAIPISLRTDDEIGGNQFTGATLAAPLAEVDVVARMQILRAMVGTARSEPALDALGAVTPVLSALPPVVMARMAGAIPTPDVQASNVPGHRGAVYFAGASIDKALGIGPVPGAAMMVVLLSHASTCSVTVNYDPAAVTEPDVLEACLREGFDEILKLGSMPDGKVPAKGRRARPA